MDVDTIARHEDVQVSVTRSGSVKDKISVHLGSVYSVAIFEEAKTNIIHTQWCWVGMCHST